MKWQEYQEAVACLYEQAEEIGEVQRNVLIPDRITGQNRQIDVLLIVRTHGHELKILIDAKFHSDPIDVKVVEEVQSLAEAVGASKAVIVAPNGWTKPAGKKAEFESCDLKLLTVEEALDLIVPDKWEMCQSCGRDCIVLDQDGIVQSESGGCIWWLAGRCRHCKNCFVWCQDCGEQYSIELGNSVTCGCGYIWSNEDEGLNVYFGDGEGADG